MDNTPGPGGYVLAWAVSVTVCAALFSVYSALDGAVGADGMFGVFLIYGFFIAIFSIPFTLVGVALVQLACGRVAAQSVHVLAAALAGLLPLAYFSWTSGWYAGGLFLIVPFATAVGRWSVVPLVRQRRRKLPVRPGAPAAR